MKKLLLALPVAVLLSASCNSPRQAYQNTTPNKTESAVDTPVTAASSTAISLVSPDGNKIISYDRYNGYSAPQEPATIFTVKNVKTGNEYNIEYFIPAANIGRGIDQWYWIDNRYVLISGDGLISILDTTKLKQIANLIGLNPKLSKDRKVLTYTEIEPPLYGPGAGKTKIKNLNLATLSTSLIPIPVIIMETNLFGADKTETITVYQIPTTEPMAADNFRIEVTSESSNQIIFKENLVPFAGQPDLRLIQSAGGKEGVMVTEYPSAADGGREAWHILTATNGKIVRLDRSEYLKQPLLKNGFGPGTYTDNYYIFAYAAATSSKDEIIETIPTDPLPNGGENITLEFHFRFTGDSIELLTAKEVN